jgi:hypothetical protein
MSTVSATLIAVPLAYFTVRFRFRGALLIQTLGVLPLIMPPFVGAVALQLDLRPLRHRQPAAAGAPGLHGADHGRARRPGLRAGHPLLPLHPHEPHGGAAQHRRRHGGGGAQPRLPGLAAVRCESCSRWRCPGSSPAPRSCSSRSSTTWARRW